MSPREDPLPHDWAEQLKAVMADAQALRDRMRRVRETLPPVQSGIATRLQEFEDTLNVLLNDESLRRLLAQ